MAFCKKCGNELENDAEFCTNCGTAVTKKTNDRQTEFEGKIFKCPNCGEVLKSFTADCPACGYELRGSSSTGSVKELAKKLEAIESERVQQPKTGILEKVFTGQRATKTDEQKISLIQSFPIPNTKEDLYEFLVLSQSNIDIDLYDSSNGQVNQNDVRRIISNAWKSKFEQAYQKSKLVFKNDERMSEIQKLYDDTNKTINKAKTRVYKTLGIVFGSMFGFCIVIGILVPLIPSDPVKNRQSHLEYVVEQIEDDISEGKCKDAKNKAYTLTFDETLDSTKHEYWKNKQTEILEQIENACSE